MGDRGNATGFPISEDHFAGEGQITKGQSTTAYTLAQLLNQLEDWNKLRGVCDAPGDLPTTDMENGDCYVVRESAGVGTPPAFYLYDADTTTWVNVTSTGLPANHASTHETGGLDEVDIQSLLGTPQRALGDHVFIVDGTGANAPYQTVQSAVDDAATLGEATVIFVMPGTYDEDVVIRDDDIHLFGVGGRDAVIIKSVTITNATVASLATFNGSGAYTDLAVDGALTNPPKQNKVWNIEFNRSVNVPAWVGDAIASVRMLGGDAAGSTFGRTGAGTGGFQLYNCQIRGAAGAAGGTGAIYADLVNYIFLQACIVGESKFFNCAGLWTGANSEFLGVCDFGYDSVVNIPVDPAVYGVNALGGYFGEIELNGDTAVIGGQAFVGCTVGDVDINTTAVSASTMVNCHIHGAIDLAVANPTLDLYATTHRSIPTGAGAAGVTVLPLLGHVERGLAAGLPGGLAAGDNGQLYVTTDAGMQAVNNWDGAQWIRPGIIKVHGSAVVSVQDVADDFCVGTATPRTAKVTIEGGVAEAFTQTAAPLTLDKTHGTVAATGGAGGIAIALPPANTCAGRIYRVVKDDAGAGAVTVTPNGGDTIIGAANYPLAAQWDGVTVVSDGVSNWVVTGVNP